MELKLPGCEPDGAGCNDSTMKKLFGRVQQGLDRLEQDRSGAAPNSGSVSPLAASPSPTSNPPSKRDIYLHRKQRGVNLGSWFSLESWLTPSLFQTAREPKGSELDVVAGMNAEKAKAMLEHHWDTFINDGDLQWLVDHGVNTVRIPMAYFHYLSGHPDEHVRALLKDTDFEQYATIYTAAYSKVHRAIEKAGSRGIGVLVDLHGAPGGQNADGHCGVSNGRSALWNSRRDQEKTIAILVSMANDFSRYENVVGLELINEPKNSDKLQGFYEEVVRQVRRSSPHAASLPLYLGDAWDINHYSGFVGAQSTVSNFLVDDFHLYKCFTPEDHRTKVETHAAKLFPGNSPDFNDQSGCGELSRTLYTMSQRCGRSLIIGEWSAALNPASLHHLSSEEKQRAAKAEYAHNQWKTFDKFCAGYFFWTLKKEGPPDTGWGFYSAVERGVLPSHLDPHHSRSKTAQELEQARLSAQTAASRGHEGYWDKQKGGPYEHWRFAEGFDLAWSDSLAFMQTDTSNEIGFEGQWLKTRTAAHANEKGQGSRMIWEFEHGFSQGLSAFKTALYR